MWSFVANLLYLVLAKKKTIYLAKLRVKLDQIDHSTLDAIVLSLPESKEPERGARWRIRQEL